MLSNVELVCGAGKIIKPGVREVTMLDTIDENHPEYTFIVKYYSDSPNSMFMNFKDGTLLVITGRLCKNEEYGVFIIAEKVQYLTEKKMDIGIL